MAIAENKYELGRKWKEQGRALRDIQNARDELLGDLQRLDSVRPEDIDEYWGRAMQGLESYAGLSGQDMRRGMLGDSELGGARADSSSIAAQRQVLAQLQEAAQGKVTDADRAAMSLARSQLGEQQRGQQQALLNQYEARGMGGSGTALQAALAGQGSSANALAAQQAQMDIARRQQALAAMQGAGSLASGMRGQSFGEDATRKGARDAFAQANAAWQQRGAMFNREGQRMSTSDRNALTGNRAAANTAQANTQFDQEMNKTQTGFEARSRAADMRFNRFASADPESSSRSFSNVIGSIGFSDRAAKDVIGDVDRDVVLDRLRRLPVTAWSYKAEHGQPAHIGPMAQDFAAVFGVGGDNRVITQVDADGVLIAAVQALADQVDALRAEVRALRGEK